MAQTIGVIGGTGPEGKGLAARFAVAGLEVIIGSRSAERGEEAAAAVAALAERPVRGDTNAVAAQDGEIVLLTVPYAAQSETLAALADALAGKIVVSTVVPLEFKGRRIAMLEVPGHSAAEEAQALLPGSRVVGGFHNLAAGHLFDLPDPVDGDVIVCGDDADAVAQVMALAELIAGVRGINGGPLACSRYVEGITALQININRIYKAQTHVRILGI